MLPLPLPQSHGRSQKPLQAMVLWVIWFSITVSIFIYQFTLGRGLPHGTNAPGGGLSPVVVLAIMEILIATAVRWFVLPRAKHSRQMLVAMIIGLALSEAVEFYGIFLIPAGQPQTKLSLFILSLLSCAQFAPIYARSKPAPDAA